MEDKVEKDRAALAKERTAFERSLRPPSHQHLDGAGARLNNYLCAFAGRRSS
jgi:hypothetical protein